MAAYAYLVDPEKQFMTKSGTINVAGFLRVYDASTDDRVITYQDFQGTENEFDIKLDNNGRAIVIADSARVYRLEVYDRYGSLQWTTSPLWCLAAGGGAAIHRTDVVSTDGSLAVDKVEVGSTTTFDLSTHVQDGDDLIEAIRCDGAEVVQGTDIYRPIYTAGTMEVGDKGLILLAGRYYHVTAHVKATKSVQRDPFYDEVNIRFVIDDGETQTDSVVSKRIVDYSLGLSQEFEVSTDVIPETDCELLLVIDGHDVQNGSFELLDLEAHRVYSGAPYIPSGVLSRAQAADIYQEKLIAGDNITIEGNVISATGDFEQVQSDWTETDTTADSFIRHKPQTKPVVAGQNIVIDETSTQFVISATAEPQEQANWNESDSSSVQYIQNKPDLSVYATGSELSAGLATKQDVISDLATIRSGAAAGATAVQQADLAPYATTSDMNTALAGKQDTLTAGANIDITNNVISATAEPQVQADWAQTDSSEVDFIKNKPDLSVYATTSAMNTALAGKQDVISDLSDIRAGAALGDTAVQPTDLATVATTGDYDDLTDKPDLSIYAESADLATVATTGSYADLTNTPSIPTATSDLTNDSNYITAAEAPVQDVTVNGTSVLSNGVAAVTVPTATSDLTNDSGFITLSDVPAQVQADWNESDSSDPSYIENKPANLVQDASYVHTDENFTSAEKSKLAGIEAGAEVNVQADWTEADSSSDAYIANKPQNLVQDANYVHTDENFTSAEKTKLAGIAAGAEVNVQSDWAEADNTSDAYIANKPQNLVQDANYVHTDNNFTSAEKTKLSGIEAGAQVNTVTDVEVDGVSVVSQGVASITLPSVPVTDVTVNGTSVVSNGTAAVVVPAQVQSDWAESDTTDPSYIDNKPDLSVYATTSAMTTALADKQDTLTAGTNVQITNNVISATDTTYTAGTGIEISNNEISVETPVDIVAGPGIVIDNPDGNTLRVSQSTFGFYLFGYCY